MMSESLILYMYYFYKANIFLLFYDDKKQIIE